MENFFFCPVDIFVADGDAVVYFTEPMHKKNSTAFVWSHRLSV